MLVLREGDLKMAKRRIAPPQPQRACSPTPAYDDEVLARIKWRNSHYYCVNPTGPGSFTTPHSFTCYRPSPSEEDRLMAQYGASGKAEMDDWERREQEENERRLMAQFGRARFGRR